MINLLPKRYHQELTSNYRFRLVTVFLWGIVVILFVTNVLFGGFWVLMRRERTNWQKLEEQSLVQSGIINERKQIPDNLGDPKSLGQAVELIKELGRSRANPTDFFDQLLAEKNSGIKINSLSFSKDQAGKKVTVDISGSHLGRQTLVTFVEKLKSSGDWVAIDAPLSNFIRDGLGEFKLSVSGVVSRNR